MSEGIVGVQCLPQHNVLRVRALFAQKQISIFGFWNCNRIFIYMRVIILNVFICTQWITLYTYVELNHYEKRLFT